MAILIFMYLRVSQKSVSENQFTLDLKADGFEIEAVGYFKAVDNFFFRRLSFFDVFLFFEVFELLETDVDVEGALYLCSAFSSCCCLTNSCSYHALWRSRECT